MNNNRQIIQEATSLGLIGQSESFIQMVESIKQVAPTNITILITGESGTGKEIISKAIHQLSPRKTNPLLTVNCGAIPEGILESELFGHEKGSFTGATELRKGYFELADGGTLMLDEIGELPLPTQVKLLRILEDNQFLRVGGTKQIQVDVRILTATNRDLTLAVKNETFRKDLFYRINAVTITIPPLRRRKEDIRLLANYFAANICKANHIKFEGFAEEVFQILDDYSWPGNIRELRNLIERIIILEKGKKINRSILENHFQKDTIMQHNLPVVVHKSSEEVERELIYRVLLDIRLTVEDIRRFILNTNPPLIGQSRWSQSSQTEFGSETPNQIESKELTLKELEKHHFEKVLRQTHGNRRKAAKALGIGERTLYRKLKEYGLDG